MFQIILLQRKNGSVNPCTLAGPCESRSIIARRVGSDKAANVVPNLSTTIWYIRQCAVSELFAIPDFCSPTCPLISDLWNPDTSRMLPISPPERMRPGSFNNSGQQTISQKNWTSEAHGFSRAVDAANSIRLQPPRVDFLARGALIRARFSRATDVALTLGLQPSKRP